MMIVLFNSYGNHSNRLFQNLHFEAFCYKHNIPYYNAVFSDMSYLYREPALSKYKRLSRFLRTAPIRILQKRKLLRNIISFPENKKENIDLLRCKSRCVCFVDGWGFRAYDETKELRELFRQKYSLKDTYFCDNDLYLKMKDMKNTGG